MLNSTVQSTKSGGPLAAAWAVVHHIGDDGYRRLVGQAREATLALADAVTAIPALSVVVAPDATLLTVATDGTLRRVHDRRRDARARLVRPAADGLPVDAGDPARHPERGDGAERAGLRGRAARGRRGGPGRRAGRQVPPRWPALVASLDPATLDDATFDGLLQAAGLAGADGDLALPERMAPVNALLDAAPPRLREALLLGVLDRLSRPT